MQALELDHTPYCHHGNLELEHLPNFEPLVDHVSSHDHCRNHHIHYREQHFSAHRLYHCCDYHQHQRPAV
ncbi:hypothetical protein FSOLCH5_010860 [Fusarium solani]